MLFRIFNYLKLRNNQFRQTATVKRPCTKTIKKGYFKSVSLFLFLIHTLNIAVDFSFRKILTLSSYQDLNKRHLLNEELPSINNFVIEQILL